jgi:hypothetical protein
MDREWTSRCVVQLYTSWQELRFRRQIQFRKHITSNADWRKWIYTAYKPFLCVCVCAPVCVCVRVYACACVFVFRHNFWKRKYETNGVSYISSFTFSYFQNHTSKEERFEKCPSKRCDWYSAPKTWTLLSVTPCSLVDVYRLFRTNAASVILEWMKIQFLLWHTALKK